MAFQKITRLTGSFQYGVGDGPVGVDNHAMPVKMIQVALLDPDTQEVIEIMLSAESALDLAAKLQKQASQPGVHDLIVNGGAK